MHMYCVITIMLHYHVDVIMQRWGGGGGGGGEKRRKCYECVV